LPNGTVGSRPKPRLGLSLAFASWEVGMRERERVWWNDGFVRRTEGDELFGFGVYRVCRIVLRKMGTSLVFSLFELFSPRALFGILDFPSYHQPLTLEREARPTSASVSDDIKVDERRPDPTNDEWLYIS
jgi:hypothetical protein